MKERETEGKIERHVAFEDLNVAPLNLIGNFDGESAGHTLNPYFISFTYRGLCYYDEKHEEIYFHDGIVPLRKVIILNETRLDRERIYVTAGSRKAI